MKALAKPALRGTVHTVLAPLEAQILARQSEAKWPHIFILGAPRSGTSLFYELMITRFRLAYFTNLAHRFYKTPLAATKLGQAFVSRHRPAFQSDYGHISGWAAPNEGGWIWQRWLEDGPWTDERMMPDLPVDKIRATLAGMSNLSKAPFINKNVMHSNRVRLLDALFPGCLFLEVQRNAKDTARSIIRAQRRNKGPMRDQEEWWSVRPSNAGGNTDIERACRQVIGVARDIERDCTHVGAHRHVRIDYKALCANPDSALTKVAQFLTDRGVSVSPLAQDPIPARFTLRASKALSPEEEILLDDMLGGTETVATV